MRLIGRVDNEQYGQKISRHLTEQGIENTCEVIANRDWGADDYGTSYCNLWVIDEDQQEKAQNIFDEMIQNPDHALVGNALSDPSVELPKEPAAEAAAAQPKVALRRRQRTPFGALTLYLLIICGFLFLWGELTSPRIPSYLPETNLPYTPLFSPTINKHLMYDYPKAFSIIDKVVALFGVEKTMTPAELPETGQYLIKEYQQTPYWKGLYEMIVAYLRNRSSYQWQFDTPMFEKIQEGEWWRLFTPSLLHSDILHIFFNMFWLIYLGNQIESKIGYWRYLLFILLTGIISNTGQYMMSGANFIGFSGVLCAMFTFMWTRKSLAPWEGYDLDRMTMGFIMAFILGMAALQMISLYIEVTTGKTIAGGIGNTAHLTGALVGLLLGRWNLFAWKTTHS
jgi:GlpG protein